MASRGPTRLLIIDTSPVNSGGAQLLYRYCRHFDPERVRATMALHEDNLWAGRYRDSGVADVLVETGLLQSGSIPHFSSTPLAAFAPAAARGLGRFGPAAVRLAAAIRRRRIDVVMGLCDISSVLAALLGTATGRPAIMHLVSTWTHRFEPSALSVVAQLPAVRRVVQLSRYGAEQLPWARRKMSTIYSGIDLADFERPIEPSLRRAHGLAADVPLVGIAGRFVDVKGMDVFVRAAARIAARAPAARFFLLGDDSGAFGDQVHAMVRDLGIEDRVTFTGFVDDMHAAMADLDVLVVPSRRECAPLVVYEAMALRKPVVASRIHGIPELVEDGTTGLLAPVEDDAAFADAVLSLLADPGRRAAMGAAGRRRIDERFNVREATRQLEDIVRQAAADGAFSFR